MGKYCSLHGQPGSKERGDMDTGLPVSPFILSGFQADEILLCVVSLSLLWKSPYRHSWLCLINLLDDSRFSQVDIEGP